MRQKDFPVVLEALAICRNELPLLREVVDEADRLFRVFYSTTPTSDDEYSAYDVLMQGREVVDCAYDSPFRVLSAHRKLTRALWALPL